MTNPNWDRLWRSAGLQSAGLFMIGYFIYGEQPGLGASTDALASFYEGSRTSIAIATFVFGMAVLNLLWFAAAIRSTLRDAGQDGWGAAVTAASAIVGALALVLVTLVVGAAYRTGGAANASFTAGLNDLSWAGLVVSSFPRAMLVMAGTFGLWRAGLISNALFAIGVAGVVLVLLGGSTWAATGIWAPDGLYSRWISPAIGIAWLVTVSAILLKRPALARAPDHAMPQW